MKVEVAVLGSPSLTVRLVSVDVKQHGTIIKSSCIPQVNTVPHGRRFV